MDSFVEKIVARRFTAKQYALIAAISLAAPVIYILLLSIPYIGEVVGFLGIFALGALIYGAYRLIRSMSVEFEYIVTNGDIDIDVIVAKSKRKRIFSAATGAIEVIARYPGDHFSADPANVKSIKAVSAMTDKNIYFIKSRYKNENMVVFFQPDDRMLDALKMAMPRKVFKQDINIQG